MKNFKKGFTLVEMLIVVVIIGILAAALLPRLLSAQASARDSARMSALQQIATATAAYLQEKGDYPISGTNAKQWGTNDLLAKLIENGSVTSLPDEPQKNIQNEVIKDSNGKWKFTYAILKKNGIDDGAIVFAAKMERAGNANYVYLSGTNGNQIGPNAQIGDSSKLFLCKKVTKGSSTQVADADHQDCTYTEDSQLYYVGVY